MVLTKEFYTTQELADLLEVNERTLLRLEHKGELKAHRIGSAKRYRKEDIEGYLKGARRVEITPRRKVQKGGKASTKKPRK